MLYAGLYTWIISTCLLVLNLPPSHQGIPHSPFLLRSKPSCTCPEPTSTWTGHYRLGSRRPFWIWVALFWSYTWRVSMTLTRTLCMTIIATLTMLRRCQQSCWGHSWRHCRHWRARWTLSRPGLSAIIPRTLSLLWLQWEGYASDLYVWTLTRIAIWPIVGIMGLIMIIWTCWRSNM